ncbi:MAG: hypothetical protein J5732_03115 [Bacteroidaceae bacterium]|nr:hypothetical protein [Bacteroidaceae bacterium]
MTQDIQSLLNEQHSIILDREAKLKNYDYIGVKIAMGVSKKSDYAEEIAQTEQWRQDINAAQARIAELEAEASEDAEPTPAE